MMEISVSSLYYDPKVTRSEKEEWEADIRGKVEQIRVECHVPGIRPPLCLS